jgi:hypothetical protein
MIRNEFGIEHRCQHIVESSLSSLALQQSGFAQQEFAGHALVVGINYENLVTSFGQAFGDGDGVSGFCDSTLEVDEEKNWHPGIL